MVRPAKNRSSTRRPFRGSIAASLSRATSSARTSRSGDPAPAVLVPRHAGARPALDCPVGAGVVHEDSPHGMPGDCEKMRTALPLHPALIDQPGIGFVDERRRRQRVIVALPPEAGPGPPPQLALDDLHQAVRAPSSPLFQATRSAVTSSGLDIWARRALYISPPPVEIFSPFLRVLHMTPRAGRPAQEPGGHHAGLARHRDGTGSWRRSRRRCLLDGAGGRPPERTIH